MGGVTVKWTEFCYACYVLHSCIKYLSRYNTVPFEQVNHRPGSSPGPVALDCKGVVVGFGTVVRPTRDS